MFSGTAQDFTQRLGARWCAFMHNSPMWPIHGQYECRTCGRLYPVQWAGGGTSLLRQTPSPSFKFAVLPLVAILAMLLPANIHAADALMVTSNHGAAIVFARYIACQTQVTPWNVEAIEIDASLPKMKTHGKCWSCGHSHKSSPAYRSSPCHCLPPRL
jgi:hypothetical protein